MPIRTKIAPSILSADLGHLAQEIKDITKAGADYVHIDVMDGHFVPNLTFGPALVKAIRPHTSIPFDVHLMVTNPEKFIESFAEAGADYMTVHIEVPTVEVALREIKKLNKKAGLSLNPKTPVSALDPYLSMIDLVLVMTVHPGFGGQSFMADQMEKIEWLQKEKKKRNLSFEISVDGGVSPQNAPLLAKHGATLLVAGTSIFKSSNYEEAISSLSGSRIK